MLYIADIMHTKDIHTISHMQLQAKVWLTRECELHKSKLNDCI